MFEDKDFVGNIIHSPFFSPSSFEELNTDEISVNDVNITEYIKFDNIIEKKEEESFKKIFDKIFNVHLDITNNVNDTSDIYSINLTSNENEIETCLITPINLKNPVTVIAENNLPIIINIPKPIENKKDFKIFKEDLHNSFNKEIFIVKKKKKFNKEIIQLGKKRQNNKRRNKDDDIRKKIKSRFHKILKKKINEKLKLAGSKKLFDYLPQCFLKNITKKPNNKILNMTYRQILEMDFSEHLFQSKSVNENYNSHKKYENNLDVLKYLDKNPLILKNSDFNIICSMTYKDILSEYFSSKEFIDSLEQLKMEGMDENYIRKYKSLSFKYIDFFEN